MGALPRTIPGRVALAAAVAIAASIVALALAAPLGPSGLVLAALAAALVALPLAALLAADLVTSIEQLTRRAGQGAASSAGWSVGGPAEVKRLAAALRAMSSAAGERYSAAEADRDRLATLLREMADGVLIADGEDRITLANPAAERLLGCSGAQGRRLAEIARDGELIEAVERARRDGAAEAAIERSDPRRSISLVARRLPRGDVLVSSRDLTRLRRLEAVRRDLAANVSHELRTPLASLKAMAETLEAGALDDPGLARDFVARMHREIDDLTQVVAELLTISRVEAGAEELRLVQLEPARLLEDTAARFSPLAERAGVSLVADAEQLPSVLADRERVDQVLANLVHNAVKFTPRGGRITLTAERTGEAVRFSVVDTGEGIAREDLERVFERFFKGERSRSGGGTGLGLAIAKHMVQAHGGSIEARSEGRGHGATFSFTLPMAPPR